MWASGKKKNLRDQAALWASPSFLASSFFAQIIPVLQVFGLQERAPESTPWKILKKVMGECPAVSELSGETTPVAKGMLSFNLRQDARLDGWFRHEMNVVLTQQEQHTKSTPRRLQVRTASAEIIQAT